MIYYTGDPHGSKHEISRFCNRMRLTEQDTIVVLGDVGANYYGDVLAPGENRHFEPGENNQFQPGRNRQSVPGGCSQPRFGCRF